MFEFFLIFILGLCVGSFLNVLIDRIPRNESILGTSYCENCKKRLSWHDLIPLFSFALLGGKCRYCRKKISLYYPLVELITGALFVSVFFSIYQLPITNYQLLSIIYHLFIVSSLIAIFFTDLKYGIIPDKIVYTAILVSFIYLILNPSSLISALLAAFGAMLFFLFIIALTRGKGMGFGDVKLAFLMGLFLGFPKIVIALYLAFLTGAVAGVILILWGKKKLRGSTIPFGPFLVLATLITFFWGSFILNLLEKFIPF